MRLLDKIEDTNGAGQADTVLAIVRRVMNWYAARSDDFRSPIVRGMARRKPSEHARSRILTDDEIRAVWKAADEMQGPFGHYVRFLLLTGARRNEAAHMRWSEVVGSRLGGMTRRKADIDQASGVTGWTLHDLRRTARSLMARAGVPSEHAERCLGHVIGGVEGTYDRHNYRNEMLIAYEKLATLISGIVDPKPSVVAMAR